MADGLEIGVGGSLGGFAGLAALICGLVAGGMEYAVLRTGSRGRMNRMAALNATSVISTLADVATVGLDSFNLDDWMSRESYDANGNTTYAGGRTFATTRRTG
jgi:hypothetical protein